MSDAQTLENRTVLYNVENSIATITLNRPHSANTLNPQMIDEIIDLTEKVRIDDSIRALILNGEGPIFMAGGDLAYFFQHRNELPKQVVRMIRRLNQAVMNLYRLPIPVLASVHGSVAGVGMSFIAAADLCIAAQNTQFTMAYSNVGLSPDGGATYFLPRLIGQRKTMQLMMMPDLFDASAAQDLGIVNWVVPQENLAEQTQKIALRLANGATVAYAESKKLIQSSFGRSFEEQVEAEAHAFAHCTSTKDFIEGVSSFQNKKRPSFIGA
ncbi:MAG: enoyl-CoA hydratase [Waddliaceae bacterium]|nr:enoyl-CoA hydratase [Waddliaceae bacterium]